MAERRLEMNQLKEVVNAVLEQQKLQLAPSTYDARKNYLKHLSSMVIIWVSKYLVRNFMMPMLPVQ